jgi:hypothetical protein
LYVKRICCHGVPGIGKRAAVDMFNLDTLNVFGRVGLNDLLDRRRLNRLAGSQLEKILAAVSTPAVRDCR